VDSLSTIFMHWAEPSLEELQMTSEELKRVKSLRTNLVLVHKVVDETLCEATGPWSSQTSVQAGGLAWDGLSLSSVSPFSPAIRGQIGFNGHTLMYYDCDVEPGDEGEEVEGNPDLSVVSVRVDAHHPHGSLYPSLRDQKFPAYSS
jgi:hypothetical protein